MADKKYKVLLFYKYVKLKDPQAVVDWQKKICEGTGITGRVLIGYEGVNGTVAGTEVEMQRYIDETVKDDRFADIDFKESWSDIEPFPKLKVKFRKEVVTLGLEDDIDMDQAQKGKYLEPDEVQALIEKGEDVVFVDARNEYEWKIGKFENAILPDIENFREFPQFLREKKEELKDKKVVFYCTGGIRCEKATALAVREGYEDVYHIHGGIQRYAEKYPKGGYKGAMYVFDNRIAVHFDEAEDRTVLTECEFCHKPWDVYKNCFNATCNRRMIVCEDCFKKNEGCCSDECREIKYPRKDSKKYEQLLSENA